MRVLMFGWEFPPFNTGGLGTACYGLTKGLSKIGVQVTFVIPRSLDAEYTHMKLLAADMQNVRIRAVSSALQGYITTKEYDEYVVKVSGRVNTSIDLYGGNLFEEVERYAKKAAELAAEEAHDVIHAHDWLTFKAGIAARAVSGKPLIVHVHATEFDRTGGHGVNQDVYDVERAGLHSADAIVAVSNYTKSKIVEHYGIAPEKVMVVHNGMDPEDGGAREERHVKTVLYMGRLTLQKGPDYFIEAARRVLDIEPDTRFIIAGTGDMERALIEKAAALGISDHVLFTGFLRKEDIAKAYRMADLYVMPSVSEPFGLTPLEAIAQGTPVLISKQSGVSEVLSNCLKVDFWDVEQMASKIISVLRHQALQQELSQNATRELGAISWEKAAKKCAALYDSLAKG